MQRLGKKGRLQESSDELSDRKRRFSERVLTGLDQQIISYSSSLKTDKRSRRPERRRKKHTRPPSTALARKVASELTKSGALAKTLITYALTQSWGPEKIKESMQEVAISGNLRENQLSRWSNVLAKTMDRREDLAKFIYSDDLHALLKRYPSLGRVTCLLSSLCRQLAQHSEVTARPAVLPGHRMPLTMQPSVSMTNPIIAKGIVECLDAELGNRPGDTGLLSNLSQFAERAQLSGRQVENMLELLRGAHTDYETLRRVEGAPKRIARLQNLCARPNIIYRGLLDDTAKRWGRVQLEALKFVCNGRLTHAIMEAKLQKTPTYRAMMTALSHPNLQLDEELLIRMNEAEFEPSAKLCKAWSEVRRHLIALLMEIREKEGGLPDPSLIQMTTLDRCEGIKGKVARMFELYRQVADADELTGSDSSGSDQAKQMAANPLLCELRSQVTQRLEQVGGRSSELPEHWKAIRAFLTVYDRKEINLTNLTEFGGKRYLSSDLAFINCAAQLWVDEEIEKTVDELILSQPELPTPPALGILDLLIDTHKMTSFQRQPFWQVINEEEMAALAAAHSSVASSISAAMPPTIPGVPGPLTFGLSPARKA
ncbi:unnamed protein product, partial [Protopolystoma xenopodis]